MRIQAVGGWVRYRCEARPSNASRPCSSSKVPSGSPTWACFVTRPFDSGNMSLLPDAPPWTPQAFLAEARSFPCRFSRSFFFRSRSCAHRTLCRSPLPMDLSSLWLLVGFVSDRQLGASLAGRVDGVQERRSHAGLLQVPDGHDGGSAGRGHHL